jgi:hypothetical protein
LRSTSSHSIEWIGRDRAILALAGGYLVLALLLVALARSRAGRQLGPRSWPGSTAG